MCERCGGNFEPEYRYNLSLTVSGDVPWWKILTASEDGQSGCCSHLSTSAVLLLCLCTLIHAVSMCAHASPQLSDHTGETWATAFAEQGMEIMGNKSGAPVHGG